MRFTTLLLLAGITIFFSCKNDSSPKDTEEDTLAGEETIILTPEERPLWVADYDTAKHEFYLKQQRQVNADTLKAENLLADINAAWPEIRLAFKKISRDTLYITIPESEFLTQRMGSSGSTAYIAGVTYTLTELKGIRYVNYDFEEGEHFTPGTYSRDDFKDFR